MKLRLYKYMSEFIEPKIFDVKTAKEFIKEFKKLGIKEWINVFYEWNTIGEIYPRNKCSFILFSKYEEIFDVNELNKIKEFFTPIAVPLYLRANVVSEDYYFEIESLD